MENTPRRPVSVHSPKIKPTEPEGFHLACRPPQQEQASIVNFLAGFTDRAGQILPGLTISCYKYNPQELPILPSSEDQKLSVSR
jgi:hypothetical protein